MLSSNTKDYLLIQKIMVFRTCYRNHIDNTNSAFVLLMLQRESFQYRCEVFGSILTCVRLSSKWHVFPRAKSTKPPIWFVESSKIWVWVISYFSLALNHQLLRLLPFFLKGTLMRELKISLIVLIHTKIIPWKFRILNLKNSRFIPP